MLTFGETWIRFLGLLVAANFRVAKVPSGHQCAASRGADRSAGIVLRKSHAFGGKAIDVGRGDFFLTVATQLTPSKVVGKNEDNIEPSVSFGAGGRW